MPEHASFFVVILHLFPHKNVIIPHLFPHKNVKSAWIFPNKNVTLHSNTKIIK